VRDPSYHPPRNGIMAQDPSITHLTSQRPRETNPGAAEAAPYQRGGPGRRTPKPAVILSGAKGLASDRPRSEG